MTSRTSFYNILKEDLRRRVWMLALSALASFITMPIAFLMANRNYLRRHAGAVSRGLALQECYIEFFHSYGAVFQSIVLGVGAIIVAVWGFRQLYSRKMMDLYHSIPVKRETLFFATYINGLLIWLLPMLTATFATLLIALGNLSVYGSVTLAGPVLISALKLIFIACAGFLSVYHFALVCVMLSGNVVNALFQISILGCSVGAFYLILTHFCDTFLDTYADAVISIDQILWASPLIGPFRLMVDFADCGAGGLFWNVSKSRIDSPYLFRIFSLLLMLFHFGLALFLYKKRPSELAEHGIDAKPAQILMRFCTGTLSALFGSLIFLWMMDKHAFAWQIFGLLFCGTLGLGITDIIMQVNFKAFFQHKLQMALCLAFSVFTLSVVFFDLTGFDHRLPAKDRIASASVMFSHYNDNSHIFTFEEDTIVSVSYHNHNADYTDLDHLYPLLEVVTAPNRDNQSGVGTITVKLQTPLGTFHRRYRILSEDKELVRPIVESREYQEAFYPASLGLLPLPQELHVQNRMDRSSYTASDPEEIKAILAAYREDFSEHATLEELNTGLVIGSLEFPYPYRRSDSSTLQSYSFELELYTHYTRTLEKIQEYYPNLPLSLEELNITSIEFTPADLYSPVIFGLDEAEWEELLNESSESILWKRVIIEDPEEIALLLPHLVMSMEQEGMFSPSQETYYFGQGRLDSGTSVELFVRDSQLPLPITKAMKEILDSRQKN